MRDEAKNRHFDGWRPAVETFVDSDFPQIPQLSEPFLGDQRFVKKSTIFLHYILHQFGAFGEFQAQMGEQNGDVLVGFGGGS